MSTNYSPAIVTDGAVFVGDALMPSISEPGTRLYNRAGVDSADVKLLIHGNVGSGQSFSDSSLSNHAITAVGNATHSSTQSKFSGGSIKFDGTGDYLTAASSSDFNLLEQDFTIDMWINFGVIENFDICDIKGYADGLSFRLKEPGGAGTIGCYLENNNHTWTWTPSTSTWYHLALVRYGATLKCYVNGTALTATAGGNPSGQSIAQGALQIGQWLTGAGAQDFEGYIDEFRFTKAVALWTQDFTPPARRDTLSISDGMMYNGSCFDFDGTDDVVQTSDPIITGTGDFTFTAWINCATFTSSNFICGNYGTGNTSGVEFYAVHNNKLYLHIAGAVISDTLLTEDTWYHVAATRTSGLCQLYIDGVADGAAVTRASSIVGNNDFSIGNGEDYTSENMDGKIADVKFFDVALSVAQIKELYDDSKVIVPSNVSQTNLKGWWPLTEGAGDICYDGSGNGYHGTATNTDGDEWLTGQTGCPQLVEGYNRPMTFDGSSDYLKCGDVGNFTGSLSVSFWFYPNTNASSSRLIAKDMASGGAPRWLIYKSTSPSLILYFDDNVNTAAATSASFSTYETWHHFAATITSGEQKIYIDGAAVGAVDTQTTSSFTTDNDLWIGRYASLSYFDGIINEVVLYDSVLTLAQVQVLAATGPNGGPLPPNPMSLSNSSDVTGYWRNDGNVTWADRSGNGYTGTVYGSPPALLFKQGYNGRLSTSTGRDGQGFPLKFKNNGAVGFPFVGGVDDVGIKIAGINPTAFSHITVSAWVKIAAHSNWGTIAMQTDNNTFDEGWGLNISGSTNNLTFWVDLYHASTTADVSSHYGKWLHVVGTYNGTDQKLYFNGVEVSSNADTWTNKGAATNEIHVGAGMGTSNAALKYGLDGQIGNIQIYNRTLSYAEIQQNYNAQKSRFT